MRALYLTNGLHGQILLRYDLVNREYCLVILVINTPPPTPALLILNTMPAY